MFIRNQVFDTIVGVFKKHGAVSIETPVMELKVRVCVCVCVCVCGWVGGWVDNQPGSTETTCLFDKY